jgi:hypothetical protein
MGSVGRRNFLQLGAAALAGAALARRPELDSVPVGWTTLESAVPDVGYTLSPQLGYLYAAGLDYWQTVPLGMRYIGISRTMKTDP